MPFVQDVSADVDIDGRSVIPTDLEVSITGSTTANSATISGYMDDPEELRRNQTVTIEINDETILVGDLKRAVQDTEGELTIEAYGHFYEIHTSYVRLEMESPSTLRSIVSELLSDYSESQYDEDRVVDDLGAADPGDIYVAPGSAFPGGNPSAAKSYGSGTDGKPLTGILKELSNSLNALLWTDRNNVLRFEPAPDTRSYWDAQYIVEGEAGNSATTDENQTAEVFVESTSGSVGGDLVQQYIHSRVNRSETSNTNQSGFIEAIGETVLGPLGGTLGAGVEGARAGLEERNQNIKTSFRVRDDNVATQKELEKFAVSEQLNMQLSKNRGSISLVGTADPSPYDALQVPDNDKLIITQGDYLVGNVTHTLDNQDGWVTEIALRDEISEFAGQINGLQSLIDAIVSFFEDALEDLQILEPTQQN